MNVINYYAVAYPSHDCRPGDAIRNLRSFQTHFLNPHLIYCDLGSHFVSSGTQSFLDERGIHHDHSISGSRKSTGMVEVETSTLESVLRKLDVPWDIQLPDAISHVNSRIIRHIK